MNRKLIFAITVIGDLSSINQAFSCEIFNETIGKACQKICEISLKDGVWKKLCNLGSPMQPDLNN